MKNGIILILFLLISSILEASHVVGSDVSYKCTATPGVYKVTLKVYRDCQGINFCQNCQNPIPNGSTTACTTVTAGFSTTILGVDSPFAGQSFGNYTLSAISGVNGYDIVQTCVQAKTICTNCNTRNAGTFSPGIELFTFEGNVNLNALPSACCKVALGFSICCRNGAITQFTPGNFYTECIINRCVSSCNSAPTFANEAVIVACAGVDYVYNVGAIDPDGDSLSYSFGEPYQGQGAPVSWNPPFNANYPFPYLGAPNANAPFPAGLRMDPINGNISFRPTGSFVSNLVVEVKQWKKVGNNVINVGIIRRDVQLQSILCGANLAPKIKIYRNGNLQNTNKFSTLIGQQICLDIVVEDQSQFTPGTVIADTTDLNWNNPNLYDSTMQNATWVSNYIVSQRTLNGPKADSFKFCWTPPLSAISNQPHTFTVNGKDRFCPVATSVIEGISIKVDSISAIFIENSSRIRFCNNATSNATISFKANAFEPLGTNVYTALLSDSLGNFTNNTVVGTKADSNKIGTMPITIPSGLPASSNYRIRIISSGNTSIAHNPFTIAISKSPIIGAITGSTTPSNPGVAFNYSVAAQPNTTTYNWTVNNGTIQSGQGSKTVSILFTNKGAAKIFAQITDSNTCLDSTSLNISVQNVSVQNIDINKELSIYPNPSKTLITISNKSKHLAGREYRISNLVGQTLMSGKLNTEETQVNIESLSNGVYLLSIEGLNSQSIKVVKE